MVPLSFPILARSRFITRSRQEERDDEYLIVEQCLADGFRASRCRSRRCEWGRLVGHYLMV